MFLLSILYCMCLDLIDDIVFTTNLFVRSGRPAQEHKNGGFNYSLYGHLWSSVSSDQTRYAYFYEWATPDIGVRPRNGHRWYGFSLRCLAI